MLMKWWTCMDMFIRKYPNSLARKIGVCSMSSFTRDFIHTVLETGPILLTKASHLNSIRCQDWERRWCHVLFDFFPTCQVRVVRFYQSCSPPPPPPPPPPHPPPPPRSPDPSGHSRTSTASSRFQWAQPDLHRELQIPVGTAGPQPRLPGRSGHRRTSTQIAVGTLGPQPCRTSTATSRSEWALPDPNGKNVRKDVR